MNDVTTIIVARDDSDSLVLTLAHHEVPVIVVHPTPSAAFIARLRQVQPEVEVVSATHGGLEAFNDGVRAARTRYVALCDESSWWDRSALADAAQALDAYPTVGLIAGTLCDVDNHRCDPLVRGLDAVTHDPDGLPGVQTLGFVDCFCIVRRQPFLDQGGFDSVTGWGGLEQRIALDMSDAGWAVRFLASLVAWRRSSAPVRVRRIRDDVVTAFARRPWGVVVGRLGSHVRHGPTDMGALWRAFVVFPDAWGRRRKLSDRTELKARRLYRVAGSRALYHVR